MSNVSLYLRFKFLCHWLQRYSYLIFRILLLFTYYVGVPQFVHADDKCNITLGGLFPLTGPGGLIGERARQAAVLAHEELAPQTKARISLLFEDTQMRPAVGFSAARKLMADRAVVGLTGFGSETVSAIATEVEKSKIPGIFVTPDKTPLEGKQYLFRHWVDGRDMFPVLLPELQQRNLKRIALVYSELPAMIGFGKIVEDKAKESGLTLVYQNSILPEETDFRTITAAIKQAKPDAVLFFLLPPQPSFFMKQLRVSNPTVPVFSFINTENSREVQASAGTMEGIVYPGPVFTKEFIRRFEERFHEFPEFAAGNVYDIVHMFAKGLESGACTREEMAKYISTLNTFEGALGNYGLRDKNDFRFPVQLKTIHDGRFVAYPLVQKE